ncbi:hypothetical protein ABZ891_34565 [Streptomyces sp. NPDC047023]|uniref:hypothetical protein n=1 Tax=Streptomyces sp. NPDC047023 TaxID=3155139 RepID=UPI0033F83C49
MLTSAELSDAVLSGKHSGFEATPQSDPLLEDVDVVTASDPACQPLADLRSVTPRRTATGTAWAALQADDRSEGGSVVLTSYPEGEAKASMSELKAAVTRCKDITLSSGRGWTDRGTLKALPSVGIGDESVSFSTVSTRDPAMGQTMTVVRTGGSLAVYLTTLEGDSFPAALIERQHEQLLDAG